VRTADGRTLSGEVRNARGNPATPLSREEVASKFRRNVDALVEPALTEDVLAALLDPAGGGTGSLAVLARRVLALLPAG
jgi:hypothetical protein